MFLHWIPLCSLHPYKSTQNTRLNGWLLAGCKKLHSQRWWMVDWATPHLKWPNIAGSTIYPCWNAIPLLKKVGCIEVEVFPRKKKTHVMGFFPHQTTTATLPKFNMEPKNDGLQKESPIPGYHFSGSMLNFGKVVSQHPPTMSNGVQVPFNRLKWWRRKRCPTPCPRSRAKTSPCHVIFLAILHGNLRYPQSYPPKK